MASFKFLLTYNNNNNNKFVRNSPKLDFVGARAQSTQISTPDSEIPSGERDNTAKDSYPQLKLGYHSRQINVLFPRSMHVLHVLLKTSLPNRINISNTRLLSSTTTVTGEKALKGNQFAETVQNSYENSAMTDSILKDGADTTSQSIEMTNIPTISYYRTSLLDTLESNDTYGRDSLESTPPPSSATAVPPPLGRAGSSVSTAISNLPQRHYNNLDLIDWEHEYKLFNNIKKLEGASGKKKFLRTYRKWLVLITGSILAGLMMILMDYVVAYLTDLKYGHCSTGIFKLRSNCDDSEWVTCHPSEFVIRFHGNFHGTMDG
ncbi:unnamed protein product [Ambrosiozyma monospora]|uniref:Unnamed protein product n=1 Tax=Ambrosiozyma monospora TaxID=43982 RepID=A0ACB5SX46_AMBMO|nr:unnamed protein product [Ambrosiozyma monospora]